MWEMVESPGNELDLPKRGHRIIGAEGRGRNLGSTRIGGHRKYIQQGDPKELVLEAKLKREFPEGRQVKQSVVRKPERQFLELAIGRSLIRSPSCPLLPGTFCFVLKIPHHGNALNCGQTRTVGHSTEDPAKNDVKKSLVCKVTNFWKHHFPNVDKSMS